MGIEAAPYNYRTEKECKMRRSREKIESAGKTVG